jgi:tripartite-type tricarboxylate transporter receptor subunit TctC
MAFVPALRRAAALVLGLAAAGAGAQDSFPSRPLTLVVPFEAGSDADSQARRFAQSLAGTLHQPVTVTNRPGASGAAAAQAVAASAPDGHTLLIGSVATQGANQTLYAGRLPYDPKALVPVAGLAGSAMMLVAPQGFLVDSVRDVIAAARRQPGRLTCGSGTSLAQAACEMFRRRTEIDTIAVSYATQEALLADLAAGQVSFGFVDAPAALPMLSQQRIRAVGIAGSQRLSTFHGVALFSEQGFGDFDLSAWTALFAPAATPGAVVARLNDAVARTGAVPEMVQWREASGSVQMPGDAAYQREFVEWEIDRWARFVRESGVRGE